MSVWSLIRVVVMGKYLLFLFQSLVVGICFALGLVELLLGCFQFFLSLCLCVLHLILQNFVLLFCLLLNLLCLLQSVLALL